MLSVTGINRFYYLCDFMDMHYKRSRVLYIICEYLHRELVGGDVFIVTFHVESLESSLKDEVKKRKAAERKVADLKAKPNFADKNRFGEKSQSVKQAVRSSEESDRSKEKDDFDGMPKSLPENFVLTSATITSSETQGS